MTSIGCDCIILVIINGYVHLGSEGGQYVGHERAAKLVPTRVPLAVSRPRARHAPLMRQSEGIRSVLPPSGRAHGGFKTPQARCSLYFPRQPRTGKGEIFNNLVIQTQVSTVLPAEFLVRNLAITWISNLRRATGHR